MATQEQFQQAFERVNTATSTIAQILRDLRDKLTQGGLSADQEQEQLDRLNQVADALDAMAQSPDNPVPVEPVV